MNEDSIQQDLEIPGVRISAWLIASPASSRTVERHFPMARYVEVKGATHYCMYDRPDLIAEMIEGFFRNPHEFNSESGPA
jgi:pimeloyl-ACP methyl ester carboxylesterase